jgi:ATP/ADP translocase
MRDKLRTLLGIEPGEESMVSMLLTQSVFLGIFIGAFDITAHSLLLSTFNEKMMARGYAVSGIAGIILISFYSFLKTRLQFKNFAIINLIVVTVLTLFLWSALIFSPVKWIIFMVFVMFGPLNLLVLYSFWGTADRLFTRRQGKRLLRLADTGLIMGIIIISFAIPIIISFKFHSHSILLVSASSVLIATIIQSVIGTRFSLASIEGKQYAEKPDKIKPLLAVFRDDLYVRTIASFAALSVLAAFFIQYLFMAITREQYPVAEDMAAFLGFFTGSMMILILFVKMLVFPYILHNYGLRTCFMISPVLIAVITAIVIPTGLIMGYSPETASGFLVFFLILAFSRLISKSLKDSVEFPSLKVINQLIDKKVKSGIRPGMAGTVNEIAVIFSGLILTGLGLFSFMKLIHFSLILFIIVIIWLLVAFRLFREYGKSIIRSIEVKAGEGSRTDISNKQDTLKNRYAAHINFRTNYFSLISGDFSVLNKIRSKWYYEEIIAHAYSKKDINLLPVLKRTANNTDLDEGVRQHSSEAVDMLQKHSASIKSDNEKISEAIKILSDSRMPQTPEILRLLREKSLESKKLAIYMIGKFRLADLLSEVCECMSIPGLTKDAFEVLKTFGSIAEKELVRYYFITSGNTKLSKTILQLLGKNCSGETNGFLFSRLRSNSRQLKEIVVKCLIDCGFKPSQEEKQQLNQLISEVIGSITWNLSAKITLERDNDNFLLDKINGEMDRWNKFLYNILSITYNSGSVDLIMENIGSGTFESITYALEMADILFSDSIKPKLISLLEVVPDEDKVMNLFQFFPGEIPLRKKLLEDIINRDYNLISLWTKACTLRSINRIESADMAESVTALLFSPEELIQEESANLIARSNPGLYESASERIPDSIKTRLDKIINGTTDKEEFLFEKMQFLSKRIGIITEDELLSVASEMRYIKNLGSESLLSSEGFFMWRLYDENETNEVNVVFNEEIERLVRIYQGGQNLSFYFLPFSAVEEYHFQFPDKSFEILKYIDINEEESELNRLKNKVVK